MTARALPPPLRLARPLNPSLRYTITVSPAFLTGRPAFNDLRLQLDELHATHCRVPATTSAPVTWNGMVSRTHLASRLGAIFSAAEHRRIAQRVSRLLRLPAFAQSASTLAPQIRAMFEREDSAHRQFAEGTLPSEDGVATAMARRKTARARVWLVPIKPAADGSRSGAQVMVNSQSLDTFFRLPANRESAMRPLSVTGRAHAYNAWCRTHGGGSTGQCEAVRLALARALVVHEPALKPVLRANALISHDWRNVERKKPGQKKARKKFTWVKR